MTAYVFFDDFLQFDRCGSRRNRSIWHFCHSAGNQKQKGRKKSQKRNKMKKRA